MFVTTTWLIINTMIFFIYISTIEVAKESSRERSVELLSFPKDNLGSMEEYSTDDKVSEAELTTWIDFIHSETDAVDFIQV